MASEERLRELEEKYEDYTVYDNRGSKIGKVDDLFVDEKDNEEYIGVKMGFFGRKSTLIPTEIVRVNEGDRTIEVSESKDHVKEAPNFDDDEDVTSEYEERIRRHFGLESLQSGSSGDSYGATAGSTAAGSTAGTAAAGAGTSDHDETRESGSSGYAPEGGDRESSGTRDDAHAGAHESSDETSSGETYSDDRETSSGTDSGHEQRSDPGATSSGAGTSEGSSDAGYYEQTGGSGSTGERHETSGSSGMGSGSGESSSGDSSSGSQPTTSRQTEETETFQEGGRTKIRRRIISEEVVDADDQGSSS